MNREAQMQICVLLLTAGVVSGKEPDPPEPQFPHLYSGTDDIHAPGMWETT